MNGRTSNTSWHGILAVLFCLGLLVCLLPHRAEAAQGYGTWNINTGYGNKNLMPVNPNEPEMTSFTCSSVAYQGDKSFDITPAMRSAMRTILTSAALISMGKWDREKWSSDEDGTPDSLADEDNMGFPTGSDGLRKYLALEKAAFLKEIDGKKGTVSLWSYPDHRKFFDESKGSQTRVLWSKSEDGDDEIWLDFDHDGKREESNISDYLPFTVKEGEFMASLINPKATKWLMALNWNKIPDGCLDAEFNSFNDVGLSDLWDSPTTFVNELVVNGLLKTVSAVYEGVSEPAYKWAFVTPHTERGDLMWDLEDNCADQDRKTNFCQGGTPLGFNKNNVSDKGDRPFYIDAAAAMGWLTTGLYFIILFAAAIVFMFRGNRSQTLNLMKLGPRILLALLLTIAAPFVIGAAITASNYSVNAFLSFAGADVMSTFNLILSLAGFLVDPPSSPLTPEDYFMSIINLLVAIVATFAAVLMFFGSLLRQLILIVLIILSPIAIFCSISDTWRPKFIRWMRALGVVIFLPVATAMVLTIGMVINPLSGSTGSEYVNGSGFGSQVAELVGVSGGTVKGTIGVMMVLLTALAMALVLKSGLSVAITNKSLTSNMGRALQIAAPMAAAIPGVGVGGVAALNKLGGTMTSSDRGSASLIPGGREGGGGGMTGAVAGMIGSKSEAWVSRNSPEAVQKRHKQSAWSKKLEGYTQNRQRRQDDKIKEGWAYDDPSRTNQDFMARRVAIDPTTGQTMFNPDGTVKTETYYRPTTQRMDADKAREAHMEIARIRKAGVDNHWSADQVKQRIQSELGLAGVDAIHQDGEGNFIAAYTQDGYDRSRGQKTAAERISEAQSIHNSGRVANTNESLADVNERLHEAVSNNVAATMESVDALDANTARTKENTEATHRNTSSTDRNSYETRANIGATKDLADKMEDLIND